MKTAQPNPTSIEVVNSASDEGSWNPSPGMSFQIQFSGDFDISVAADIYDLDAFDTQAAVIQELHENGRHVICYLNAGAVEDWRPDANMFPPSIIGNAYQGWPGEHWLDIRELDILAPILEARLDLCADKGFDGVEYDNVDGYQNNTGFKLTATDQLTFNRWLADAAHKRGLSVGLKNDPEQIAELEPRFDFAILESCFGQGWCDQAQLFIEAGKPVFVIEYIPIDKFCQPAKGMSVSLIQKSLELDSWRNICP